MPRYHHRHTYLPPSPTVRDILSILVFYPDVPIDDLTIRFDGRNTVLDVVERG
jgi:hypothetical protein